MSEHITKHLICLFLYDLVFPLKYRKSFITKVIGEGLKEICLEISKRYELHFIAIDYEPNHVRFLVQSVPTYSISKMIKMLILDKWVLC